MNTIKHFYSIYFLSSICIKLIELLLRNSLKSDNKDPVTQYINLRGSLSYGQLVLSWMLQYVIRAGTPMCASNGPNAPRHAIEIFNVFGSKVCHMYGGVLRNSPTSDDKDLLTQYINMKGSPSHCQLVLSWMLQ